MDERRVALRVAVATTVLGAAVFVVLAVVLVPWSPVPGGVPDPLSPSSILSDDQVATAEHYARWARTWSWSSLAVSLAVSCWLGFSRRGQAWARRVPGRWWWQVIVLVTAVTLVGRLATLPFAVASRRLRLDEGLAAGPWTAWVRDLLVGQAVTVVLTSVLLVALVGCSRRLPRAWPAVSAAVAAALVVVGSFAYPLVIEPLFNSFESLPEGPLRTQVLQLAEEEGVAVDDVLVADASRRTTTLNAYVSGFGGTRRVVLYDTLVEDAPIEETLSVVAHELAHAQHRDVLVGTLLGASGAVAGVGLLALVLLRPRRRDSEPSAGGGLSSVQVPRVLALVALGSLLAAPVQNGISRAIELRADQTALEVTNDPQAFIELQTRLALRSHADPTPPAWSQWWFGSHPTVGQRIALAEAHRIALAETQR